MVRKALFSSYWYRTETVLLFFFPSCFLLGNISFLLSLLSLNGTVIAGVHL